MSSSGSFLGPYLDPSPIWTELASIIGFLHGYILLVILGFPETIRRSFAHIFNLKLGGRISLKRSVCRRSAALILFGVVLNLTRAFSFIVDSSQLHLIHSQQSAKLKRLQPNKSHEFEQFKLEQPLKVATSNSKWMVHHPPIVAEAEFKESCSPRQRKSNTIHSSKQCKSKESRLSVQCKFQSSRLSVQRKFQVYDTEIVTAVAGEAPIRKFAGRPLDQAVDGEAPISKLASRPLDQLVGEAPISKCQVSCPSVESNYTNQVACVAPIIKFTIVLEPS